MSTELGKQILAAIKSYVSTHVDRVVARVDHLAASLEQLQATVRSLPEPRNGDKGEPGADGRTPTNDELRALIAPLIPEPIPGPSGPIGLPGPPGPAGVPGEKGAPADPPSREQLLAIIHPLIPPAIPGERGERGTDGRAPTADELRQLIAPLIPPAIPGERGKDGAAGRNGEDGRDALQIELLPAIDEARSYPRGTYARHAGGLWRSFETTAAMRGWECIVEGIAEETETLQEDGRSLIRRTIYSSGRVFERTVTMAVILDRGVYKADAHYSPGDAVTWAGSVWIAQPRADGSPYGKPSTPASGWRLSVKAGRDARS